MSRLPSLASVTLPNVRRAANRASSAVIPASRFSSASSSRCARISSFRSSTRPDPPNSPRNLAMCLCQLIGACRAENASDGFSNPLPTGMFRREVPPARGGQAVKFCAPVICGSSPFGFDPSFLQEPLERRVERAVLDLENVLRGLLDELGDAVAMHRPPAKRAQDEQVQGSLQEIEPFVGREFGCHG